IIKHQLALLSFTKLSIQNKLFEVDRIIDQGGSNEEILNRRSTLMKDLHDTKSIKALDIAQKAKVCWSIEGDENSKYFHGILNKKRSHVAIRGIFVDGEWLVDPSKVKN
ncbi:hypothetical protein Tco_0467445, partial [Tanacetum coccineum]